MRGSLLLVGLDEPGVYAIGRSKPVFAEPDGYVFPVVDAREALDPADRLSEDGAVDRDVESDETLGCPEVAESFPLVEELTDADDPDGESSMGVGALDIEADDALDEVEFWELLEAESRDCCLCIPGPEGDPLPLETDMLLPNMDFLDFVIFGSSLLPLSSGPLREKSRRMVGIFADGVLFASRLCCCELQVRGGRIP